ncbi:MAG TPA: hypothetical protein VFW33_00975 [Gemmataceae bacterium]|nr:hypothetical protein [Gemmataceae bacterium]
MTWSRHFSLTVCLWLLLPAGGLSQTRVAPLYSLPADGSWVEYEWKLVEPGKPDRAGLLRISLVGGKEVDGVAHCWVELAKESRDGDRVDRQVRKLLIKRKALEEGLPLEGNVAAGYRKAGRDGAVERLAGRGLTDLLGMGFEGSGAVPREVRAAEKVETKLGDYSARHVAARVDAPRRLSYDGWLTGEVPFGWAKIEVREWVGEKVRRTCVVTAKTSGRDARSELDESKAK